MTIYATRAVRGFTRSHRQVGGVTGFNEGISDVDVASLEVGDILLLVPIPGRATFPGSASICMGNSQWDSGAGMLMTFALYSVEGDTLSEAIPFLENIDALQQDVAPQNVTVMTEQFGRGVVGEFANPFPPNSKTALGITIEAPATTPVIPDGSNKPFLFMAGYYIAGDAHGFAKWGKQTEIVPQVAGQTIIL